MRPESMYAIAEERVAGFLREPLDPKLAERARLIALDTMAVIVRGYREHDVRALADDSVPRDDGALPLALPVRRIDPLRAILCNTASAAALELCEGHRRAKGHIALQVLPALLAAAQVQRVPGRRVLPALVLGYEIAARMGAASERYFRTHGHGIWAAAGSAVAVATVLGQDARAIVECLKIASNLSLAPSFSTHAEGATVRNLTAGLGGMIGYWVPEFLQAGYTGSLSAMAVTLGEALGSDFSPERFVEGLGEQWCVLDNYFKFDASGRHVQPAAQALREAIGPQSRDPQGVSRIRVETYRPASQLSNRDPLNALAAKTSIPYAIAAQWRVGNLGVEAFDPERLSDPVLRALMQRVEVAEGLPEPDAGAAADPAARWARVIIEWESGERLVGYCDNPPGEGDQVATSEMLRDKYDALTVPMLGEARAGRLRRLMERIDQLDDFGQALEEALADVDVRTSA